MIVGRFATEIVELSLQSPDLPLNVHLIAEDDGLDLAEFGVSQANLRMRREAGDACVAYVEQDEVLGIYWLASKVHHDQIFGKWTLPTDEFAYAHQLMVLPKGRGKGLGVSLVLGGSRAAHDLWDRGVFGLIDTNNTASLKLHAKIGFRSARLLRGVRIGNVALRHCRTLHDGGALARLTSEPSPQHHGMVHPSAIEQSPPSVGYVRQSP